MALIFCPNCGHRSFGAEYRKEEDLKQEKWGYELYCEECGRHSKAQLFEFIVRNEAPKKSGRKRFMKDYDYLVHQVVERRARWEEIYPQAYIDRWFSLFDGELEALLDLARKREIEMDKEWARKQPHTAQ